MAVTDDRLTEKIIGCAYSVANTLGHGFLEKVYENALLHELRKTEMECRSQHGIQVFYDGIVAGEYVADLLVEGTILVEVKAVRQLDETHLAQCLNYLKATGLSVCLLLNFGRPRIEVKRVMRSW
jgi:GxxExxY protein